jgi:DNA-binding response OmpR family regulator
MLQDKLVLLVDDEQSLLKATSIGLRERGFKVQTVESGESAIEAIQALRPSIVVSDLAMPGMNGFELFQEVKKTAEYKGLPFVFLTAVDDFYAKKFGKELGGAAYITKPVDLDELEQILKEKMGE